MSELSDKLTRILVASGMESARQEALEELRALEAKLKAMEQASVCAYCGQRFETDIRNSEIEGHIWTCEKHPLANLVFDIEEKCKDLDYEAQELLRASSDNKDDPSLNHASGIHRSIDAIREVIRHATQPLMVVAVEEKSDGR